MRDCEYGLRKIARVIADDELHSLTAREWCRCLYEARIGMDPRTALKWLDVAEWAGLVLRRKTGSGVLLLTRGPKFDRFVNGHKTEDEGVEDVEPAHA